MAVELVAPGRPRGLGPGPTRALLALIAVHQRDGRATVRTVATQAGRCKAVTWLHLRRLIDTDLAAQDGPGSLRPLVHPHLPKES